jgi:hypothetical protein
MDFGPVTERHSAFRKDRAFGASTAASHCKQALLGRMVCRGNNSLQRVIGGSFQA